MKKSIKKLACLFLAFTMSCQTVTAATGLEILGKNMRDIKSAATKETKNAEEIDALNDVNWDTVLSPQMGWSSWNKFHQNISEVKMREVGQAMVDTKLNEFGYTYLNLDDCWQSSMRDKDGRMQFDLTNFPSGPQFIKDMNALAGQDSKHPLKVGVYSSCGDYTCEDLTASYKNEELDAQTFAEWGVEYLKYDYCHVVDMDVDSGFITAAPDVDYITVAKANEQETTYLQAEDAKLEGNASAQGGSASKNNWYVTGLNANGGSVTFEKVNVPTAGRYVLTIGFYKTLSTKKFAEIVVNDSAKFETTIAPTSGWNNTGRQQVYIDLQAGDNTIKIHNPIGNQKDDSIRRYTKMGNALKEATAKVAKDTGEQEKPIFYSVCEHGRTAPWTWAQDFASSWRTSGDINNQWNTIVSKYDITKKLWSYQKPGAYNDPDMLEVGNGTLTLEENKAHFTLWSMMSSPLILGNDVRDFLKADGTIDKEASNGAYDIVTNQALIDINQKKPLLQCKPISKEGSTVDILVKPLDNNEVAICFFNRGTSATNATYDLNAIKEDDSRVTLPAANAYIAIDLWDKELTEDVTSSLLSSGEIPGHGVKVFKIKTANNDIEKLTTFGMKTDKIVNTKEEFTVTANVENLGKTVIHDMAAKLDVPEGFTAVLVSANKKSLSQGEKEAFVWEVTAAETVLKTALTASLTFRYGSETQVQTRTTTSSISVMKEPESQMTLGDMEWLSSSSGWSTVQRNKSVDKNPIRIDGVQYQSGAGTHAASDIKVYLGGKNYRFTAVAGIDDEVYAGYDPKYEPPQVSFELWADGVRIYDSGLVTMDSKKVEIDVTITNCRELTLRITEGGNTNAYDHADWADAKFEETVVRLEHKITIEEPSNGTITTTPNNTILDNETLEITVTPNAGYKIEKVFVNGTEVELTDGKYVWKRVREDVTIRVDFIKFETFPWEQSPVVSTPPVTPEKPNESEKPNKTETIALEVKDMVKTDITTKPVKATEGKDGAFYTGDGKKVTNSIIKTEVGERFIVNEEGEKYTSAIVTVKTGTKYVVDDKGAVITGSFIEADGAMYYTTKASGKIVMNKIIKVDTYKYIAAKTGKLITSKWVTMNGKKYYCNAEGIITRTK